MRLVITKTLVAAVATSLFATLLGATPALAERTVTIDGGGWGHGLGMSQYGAYGRAQNGKSTTEILKHYYTGVSVTERKMPGRLRVGLLPAYGASTTTINFSSVAAGGSGKLTVKLAGEKIVAGGPSDSFRAEAAGTGGFRLFKNGNRIRRDGRGVFGSDRRSLIISFQRFGSRLVVGGKDHQYRYGRGELGTYGSCGSSHCARLALALPMQKYLFGLGEVPSSWPAAVLRAQAIAGRTYAYEKSLRYDPSERSCGCHVYDSTIDQAYIGDSKRVGSAQYWTDWKSAVKATNQTVIMHGGSPIQALYSSSSGGHTENNENVWGGAPIPYLRGVADKADKAGGANPNFKWTVTMSWSEFASKLQAAYKVGEVQDFELVKPFGVSGRVTVVKSATSGGARITGSSGVEHTSGWSVRSALSLRDTLFRVDIGQPVGKVFRPLYRRLDGAPGDPTSPVYQVPRGTSKTKGRAQDFTKGRMTRNHALDKSVWQWGKVLKKYDGLGRERSKLGMPTSSIWGPGDFRGGTYKNGRIVWSDAFGAHPIVARFAKAFVRVGGVKGALGVPRGHRKARASIPDGRLQRFRNGTLYEPKKGGEVFALWGSIDERYRKMGAATSRCGPPTSDVAKEGERSRASFRDGVISWTEATGVEVDCGA